MILKAYYHPSSLKNPTFITSINLDSKKEQMNEEQFNDYVKELENELKLKYSHRRYLKIVLIGKK